MPPSPDLIVVNARIATGNARRPWATALALHDGILTALGSAAEIQKTAASTTQIIDAAGAELAIPAGVSVGSRMTVEHPPDGLIVLSADA